MSNIGKKPIEIKSGANIQQEQDKIIVSGPKGNLDMQVPSGIVVSIEDGKIKLSKENGNRELDKFFGLARSLLANMIIGVTSGFEKKLELSGVGYRGKMEGETLVLNVGFSIPVRVKAPNGINIKVEENVITVSGIDKQLVGDVASSIRKIRPPDPYKAKGIKYVGERIRRKVGKAAKAVGGK